MKKNLYFILTITTFLSSCTSNYFTPVVDIELPKRDPKLVVIADFWSGEKELTVFVTNTRSTLDNTPYDYTGVDTILRAGGRGGGNRQELVPIKIDTVTGVSVKLLRNGLAFATFNSVGYGRYKTTLTQPIAEDGATYTLSVSAPNYQTVEATQKMPTGVRLDTVSYTPDATVADPARPFGRTSVDEYVLEFQDIANQANYYTAVAQATTKDAAGMETIREVPFNSLDPLSQSNALSDNNLDGKRIVWREHSRMRLKSGRGPNNMGAAVSGTIQVVLLSISKERFTYMKSYSLYQSTLNNPLAEPVILYSNIQNGYGLFSMGASRSFTVHF